MKKIIFSLTTACLATLSQAQNSPIDQQWQHADFGTNNIVGTSAAKALQDFSPASGSFAPIVVAIIDSGTETDHPDLTTRSCDMGNKATKDEEATYIDITGLKTHQEPYKELKLFR